jgi:TPR repeat protein
MLRRVIRASRAGLVRTPEIAMKKRLACLLFAASLVPATGLAQSGAPDSYAEGMVLYEDGRYVDAMAALALAAEEGDVRAQRLLGLMYLYGERLYGSAVARDRGMALSWLYRASAQGDRIATFALTWIAAQPQTVCLVGAPSNPSAR